jgi:hypothetical protein
MQKTITQMTAWSPLPESSCSTASMPNTARPTHSSRREQIHLPHHRPLGQPLADDAGEGEGDLGEQQAEQPEIGETEPERDPRERMPRTWLGRLRGSLIVLPLENFDADHWQPLTVPIRFLGRTYRRRRRLHNRINPEGNPHSGSFIRCIRGHPSGVRGGRPHLFPAFAEGKLETRYSLRIHGMTPEAPVRVPGCTASGGR